MVIIDIIGNVWELSVLQKQYSENIRNIDQKTANARIVKGLDISDVTRVIRGDPRSNATAIIETKVNNLPAQQEYVIYYNKKGFYCKVQGQRVFLCDL